MNLTTLAGLIIICSVPVFTWSQQEPSLTGNVINFPSSFFAKINNKPATHEARQRIVQLTNKLLHSSLSGGGGVMESGSYSKSGLIGVSKIVSIKSKFFKKTRLQLLWNFLSYQQVPGTQAVKFRVGHVWR